MKKTVLLTLGAAFTINNDVFFGRLEGGSFSLKEKADIYTDMLYYASKGIHEARGQSKRIDDSWRNGSFWR